MAPTIGVNLRVTGHCNQGGRKYMEDAFVVAYQQTEDVKDLEYAYFGIFDGHGGREAALFAKAHLMDCIVSQKNFWSEDDELVLKSIRDGFIATHLAMWKEVGKWPKTVSGLPSTSGTTSSVAFIRRGKLYIGHVGDSKIVLGYQEPGSSSWLPLPLTKDHKPESPKEKKRIYSVGGLVMNKSGVERVVWNRPRIGHKGPIRRSTPFDQIPFLAVARSLGDLWSYNYLRREFVVSPEPDVSVFALDPRRDRCIILASDGLWNMVSTRTAVCIVQNAEEENEHMILEGGGANGVGKPSNNPSKLLVDKALQHWYDLRMRADNTSVVTVLLDPPGPPKSEVLLRQKIMQKLRPRDEQADLEIQPPGEKTDTDLSEGKSAKKQGFEVGCIKVTDENVTGKEKKKFYNTCELRKGNLPKPVILSPHRVLVKHPTSDEKQKSPNVDQNVPDNNVVKESEKPTDVPECNSNSVAEKANPPGEVHSDQSNVKSKVLSSDSKSNVASSVTDKSLNTCNSSCMLDSDENVHHSCSGPLLSENIQNVIDNKNSSCSKENERTHLSVVDNIVKSENIENLVTEQPKLLPRLQENPSSVSEADATLTKLPSDRSSSVHKRRLQDDGEASVPSKNQRLCGSSWSRDPMSSSCATAVRDLDLARNTRSQQRVRKMKVR